VEGRQSRNATGPAVGACQNAHVTQTSGSDASFAVPVPRTPIQPGPRPSFSVIVAAWQAADTIGVAIRCVVEQTEPPLEIVVCDDGSTDDLAGALAPFGDAVRLLRVPHGGESPARNAAAAASHGDFVVILDADDRWEPKRLERLADLAELRPDLDLIATDAWFLVDGERRGTFHDFNEFNTTDQTIEILRRNFFFAHVAVRRARWEEFGGYSPDLTRGQDWDMWLRLLLGGCVAGCVLEPLADYSIHGASLSADRYKSLMARVEVLDRAEANHRLSETQRAALAAARHGYRRRALAIRAEQLLMTGASGRRRASLALMRAHGSGPRARVRSAAAAIAPGLAGARLRRQAAVRGAAAGDRVVAPSGSGRSAPNGHDE
jgi:GT2 family glycosyltransferase